MQTSRTPHILPKKVIFWASALIAIAFLSLPALAQRSTDEQKKKEEILKEGRKLFGKEDAKDGEKNASATPKADWAVLIAIFRGENNEQEAATTLAEFRTRGMLPEAYLQKRGQATCILAGAFTGPDDPAAQAELKRIQSIEINNEAPYAGSYLAPPPQADLKGSMPEYNLRQARLIYGDKAIQTLQVAVYGREDIDRATEDDLKECRKAAEDAVVKLRQEGELAFYFHGPRRSMVCVGVFDLSDFDPQIPSYKSSRLRETQKRFPHNLYNGQAIRVKSPGQTAKLQPSALVAIPEK